MEALVSNVCVYMHICIHIYICTYIRVSIHIYMYLYICGCIYIYACRTASQQKESTVLDKHMYVYMYVCMCIYAYVATYVHIRNSTDSVLLQARCLQPHQQRQTKQQHDYEAHGTYNILSLPGPQKYVNIWPKTTKKLPRRP